MDSSHFVRYGYGDGQQLVDVVIASALVVYSYGADDGQHKRRPSPCQPAQSKNHDAICLIRRV